MSRKLTNNTQRHTKYNSKKTIQIIYGLTGLQFRVEQLRGAFQKNTITGRTVFWIFQQTRGKVLS